MKKIEVNEKTKIYVLCPAYIKSGGPELLHQLVYELNRNNINAYITYYNYEREKSKYTNDEFDKYVNKFKLVNEIEDNENNIIIMPETVQAIKKTKQFKKARKVIWWLSVDNFLKAYGLIKPIKMQGIKAAIKLFLENRLIYNFKYIKKINYHLCQSKYAIEFLKKHNINNYIYLSDYLNDTYLEIKQKDINKEDIVLYNPKKGFKFTKKIIERSPKINWIAIENMTTQQVRQLLLKSKVYIDFGNHPGKDRFPREAAICDCCIITGKRGAAKYYQDVAIQDEFKFEDKEININKILEKIELCLNDYDNQSKKFNNYRSIIMMEKEKFIKDIEEIFEKI